MKKVILFIAMLVAATTAVRGQISYGVPNDWFVTVWDISKPTNRTFNNPASTIAIPIRGKSDYDKWDSKYIDAVDALLSSRTIGDNKSTCKNI